LTLLDLPEHNSEFEIKRIRGRNSFPSTSSGQAFLNSGSLGFRRVTVSESPTCWGEGAATPNKLGTPACYPRQLPKTRYLLSPKDLFNATIARINFDLDEVSAASSHVILRAVVYPPNQATAKRALGDGDNALNCSSISCFAWFGNTKATRAVHSGGFSTP